MRFEENPIWRRMIRSEGAEDLKEQLKGKGRMRFHGAAAEEQIRAFEEKNGFRLPAKFREWLLVSDGGLFFEPAGIQIYGVSHKPIIDLTEDDLPDERYVVIGVLCSGDPILLEKGKEEICIYNHEAGRIEDDEIYPDFFAFLKDLPAILGIGD